MGELTIDRFQCRYRLPASRVQERARIDAVLADLTAGALEEVVDRAGLDPTALICIRRLEVPVALRLGGPDRGMLEAWTAAFGAALDRALAGGDFDETRTDELLVRFTSRHHALVELGVAVARGEIERRAWAWHQLGMWPAYDPGDARSRARAFTAAIAREGRGVVGVLTALAERGALPQLAADIPAEAWVELAATALAPRTAGLPLALTQTPELRARTRRTLAGSPLAPALAPLARAARADEAAALATLTLLAAEPVTVLQAPDALEATIAAAAHELQAPADSNESHALAPAAAGGPTRPHAEPETEPAHGNDEERAASADTAARADDEPAAEPLTERPTWHTANAGLLLTLGVIDDLGLPARLAADALLAERPFAEVLRALAVELAPVPADDPSVAAFCGLHRLEALDDLVLPEALSDEERAALVAAAAEVHAELRDRLGADPEGERELATLHARDADILPDPGWFEVRLAHDQTSVAIRRARLDLDPGWLPWLGAVVRFVYA